MKKKEWEHRPLEEVAAMAAGMFSFQGQQAAESVFSGSSLGRFRHGPASLVPAWFLS